jgi:hypothetical protein
VAEDGPDDVRERRPPTGIAVAIATVSVLTLVTCCLAVWWISGFIGDVLAPLRGER